MSSGIAHPEAIKISALHLAQIGMDYREIGSVLKIPARTVRDWIDGEHGVSDRLREQAEATAPLLAERFDAIANLALDRAPDGDRLDRASFRDLVWSAAIATDKARLLRGEPTVITSGATEAREARLDELAARFGKPREELTRMLEGILSPARQPVVIDVPARVSDATSDTDGGTATAHVRDK